MILKKFECGNCDCIYDQEMDARMCCAVSMTVQVCSYCDEVFYDSDTAEEHESANACEVTND